MDDCIFCKLANHRIPTEIVYENDLITAFKDSNPQAPVHVLLVPKKHYRDILELAASGDAESVMGAVVQATQAVADSCGISEKGFRLINNCGQDGGQTVMHLHFHLLGGRPLSDKIL